MKKKKIRWKKVMSNKCGTKKPVQSVRTTHVSGLGTLKVLHLSEFNLQKPLKFSRMRCLYKNLKSLQNSVIILAKHKT